ncbi:Carboxylic ester hydrolase [Mycena indigotica]|uniref:Carboxylic ester hydrolase n=1 Tax=Mycena indigotica TaxID=2126181 RepID=A0A8H6W0Q0_9AGAR|nr:Carboxylic ester hydrolase [Mycena indigotica]KAF7298756.1 Carboxylic ester hydrolase [Mycena indigotica]
MGRQQHLATTSDEPSFKKRCCQSWSLHRGSPYSPQAARHAMLLSRALIPLALAFLTAGASIESRASAPKVTLDSGVFTGKVGSSNTQSFLGIPFAQPPVGQLRFQLPQPIPAYNGTHTVTSFGPGCPQQAFKLPIVDGLPQEVLDYITNTAYGIIFPSDEDCLTINVIKPNTATSSSKLPVVAWIFGGGFELGSPAMYDGTAIVERSISMGEPVVYVSMNYRVSAFGFLASKEVRAAGIGNLGLQDQRQALRWIQKYIGAFGGDPTKVTIWGESAGAISVALQMIANNGNNEGLFRAGFMESGSPIPTGPLESGQKYYDAIVKQVGCSSAADTLACLRTVPYATLKAAQDASPGIFAYQSLALAWLPREDGVFLTDNPQRLVQQGKVANVPFVTGDCDDEGTLFSLSTLNITTDSQFINWVHSNWVPQATTAQANTFSSLYPSSLSDGSPFDTSILNGLTSQFKRIAAFQGDGVFQAPRRFFQQSQSGKQKQWGFLSKRLKAVPFLGSFHASDILNVYFDGELTDYLINFATSLNPNGQTVPNWPAYTTATPNLMTFLDGLFPTTITQDTYRADAMAFLTNMTLQFPL